MTTVETAFGAARVIGNEIEFERFVDHHPPLLPTPTHGRVSGRALRQCRCKRIGAVTTAAKRVTRQDSDLVYYVVHAASATLRG